MNFKNIILPILFLVFTVNLGFAQDEQNATDIETYLKTQNIVATTTDYGLHYETATVGTGKKPKVGDYLALNFKGKLLDGTVFQSSEQGEPFVFQVGYRQVIRGLDLGIREFPVGSKGNLYIPPNLGYGKRGAGQEVPPNASLVFEVDLVKIMSEKEYDDYMTALEEKEQAAYQAQIETQFRSDKKLIQEYALENKLRTKRTDSGLSYIITKKGKGENARIGDELSVSYEGILLDGKPFDKTKAKETFTFTLGKGKVIQGWDEGLLHFAEGSEGTLLIPSKLAYGPRAIYEENVSLPSNSVLVFKIKVEKIKRAEEEKKM